MRPGLIFVRGEQIAGEYATGSLLDDDGWFCTSDRGWIDADGYLFIEGRADDTIIRGGENIAPAEIEEVLLAHPAVRRGVRGRAARRRVGPAHRRRRRAAPGSRRSTPTICASTVRAELRGSKTPDTIVFRDQLPHTETGKLLRRVVLEEISAASNRDGRNYVLDESGGLLHVDDTQARHPPLQRRVRDRDDRREGARGELDITIGGVPPL